SLRRRRLLGGARKEGSKKKEDGKYRSPSSYFPPSGFPSSVFRLPSFHGYLFHQTERRRARDAGRALPDDDLQLVRVGRQLVDREAAGLLNATGGIGGGERQR